MLHKNARDIFLSFVVYPASCEGEIIEKNVQQSYSFSFIWRFSGELFFCQMTNQMRDISKVKHSHNQKNLCQFNSNCRLEANLGVRFNGTEQCRLKQSNILIPKDPLESREKRSPIVETMLSTGSR